MKYRRASELQIGNKIMIACSNGRTPARIELIEEAHESELLPAELARFAPTHALLALHCYLQRAVAVPDMPGKITMLWTAYARPDEKFELYV